MFSFYPKGIKDIPEKKREKFTVKIGDGRNTGAFKPGSSQKPTLIRKIILMFFRRSVSQKFEIVFGIPHKGV